MTMTSPAADRSVAATVELDAIRSMTDAMLAAAEHGRWTEVQRIDDARSALLRAVPAAAFGTGDPAVRALLRDALAATRAIERRVAAARDELARELRVLNRRQNAAAAYGDVALARP